MSIESHRCYQCIHDQPVGYSSECVGCRRWDNPAFNTRNEPRRLTVHTDKYQCINLFGTCRVLVKK